MDPPEGLREAVPLDSHDGTHFEAFTAQHYVLLAITAGGAATAVWWGRRHRNTPRERRVRRTLAAASLTVVLGMQLYWTTPGARSAGSSWPLQLSDLADYTAVLALWTRGPRFSAFTYYVGLSLTLMAVLTPSLGYSFPDVRWWGFWLRHIFVVWAAVYLVWGLGIRPTWRLYRNTVVVVLVWAAVVYPFNVAMGTNYGYLVRPPSATTPLDWFGPWPWYLLVATAFLLVVWAVVFTLPWRWANGQAPLAADDSSTPDLRTS
jgi:hypothetical integral membrane protein (TIGR02206 family)